MKDFLFWGGASILIAVFTINDWLPVIAERVTAIQAFMASARFYVGFDWVSAGGVLFFGICLLLYMNVGKGQSVDDDKDIGIDYGTPRIIDVKIIE